MAEWKQVVVSGSDISQLNNNANYVSNGDSGVSLTGSFTGSFVGDGSGLTGVTAVVGNSLTSGEGISTFSFNGSSAVSVAVSGAAALSVDTITKWTGDAFANTSITDNGTLVTITNNAVFQGDVTVNGTASFANTENLLVADRFVLFASGSTTTGDGGIIVQQATQNIGELFGYDSAATRWGLTGSFTADQSAFTPDAFMAAVTTLASTDPNAVGPAIRYEAVGNIYVSSGDESIWIYA